MLFIALSQMLVTVRAAVPRGIVLWDRPQYGARKRELASDLVEASRNPASAPRTARLIGLSH